MEDYQIEKFNKYRTRKIFSIFPFIIVNGFDNDFVWTGKWFKFVYIVEQKVRERYSYFDDGWSYQNFWGKWNENYKFIKIKNKRSVNNYYYFFFDY